jgi:hypothetical protein
MYRKMRLFFGICLLGITMTEMLESSASACSQPPGYGFILRSVIEDYRYALPVISNQVEQTLSGIYSSSISGVQGDRSSWEDITNSSGQISKLGKATPANWTITWVTGACSSSDPYLRGPNSGTLALYASSSPQNFVCERFGFTYPLSVYPDNAQNGTYAEVTMSSSTAFSDPYPTQFEIVDSYGNVLGGGAVTMTDDYDCYAGWNNDMSSPPGSVKIQLEASNGTPIDWVGFNIW